MEIDNDQNQKTAPRPRASRKSSQGFDEIFSNNEIVIPIINQPAKKPIGKKNKKYLVIAALIVAVLIFAYFFVGSDKIKNIFAINNSDKWYSVKLMNNEVFYGQTKNTSADPIKLRNVYYNYDQAKADNKDGAETANLRLVKRGKETYGPSGEIEIIRSQVIYLEPLKDDSKVLKAILDYEKK